MNVSPAVEDIDDNTLFEKHGQTAWQSPKWKQRAEGLARCSGGVLLGSIMEVVEILSTVISITAINGKNTCRV